MSETPEEVTKKDQAMAELRVLAEELKDEFSARLDQKLDELGAKL